MPGHLAAHLVERFVDSAPRGWVGTPEGPLFGDEQKRRHGFGGRIDLTLRHDVRGLSVAVELEVSRADPVTNQVKYWTARDVGARPPDEVLVSMFSPHVVRHRRNLSALFTRRLRRQGVPMFQVSLLPYLSPAEIKDLNHRSAASLDRVALPIAAELERILQVVHPRGDVSHRIHFAGDASDVVANLWEWNEGMSARPDPSWRHRRCQFFVHDPESGLFAPSKFCAFIPAPRKPGEAVPATMTLPLYAELGEQDPRFDGHRARKHLVKRLAFTEVPLERVVEERFDRWIQYFGDAISLRGKPRVLVPPPWY